MWMFAQHEHSERAYIKNTDASIVNAAKKRNYTNNSLPSRHTVSTVNSEAEDGQNPPIGPCNRRMCDNRSVVYGTAGHTNVINAKWHVRDVELHVNQHIRQKFKSRINYEPETAVMRAMRIRSIFWNSRLLLFYYWISWQIHSNRNKTSTQSAQFSIISSAIRRILHSPTFERMPSVHFQPFSICARSEHTMYGIV